MDRHWTRPAGGPAKRAGTAGGLLDASLRNRLTFGPIMLAVLLGLLCLDHYIQVTTQAKGMVRETDDRVLWARWRDANPVQPAVKPENPPAINYGIGGAGMIVLLIIILPLATEEVARLFTAENVKPYRFISAAGSASLVIHAFMTQFPTFQPVAASNRCRLSTSRFH